jgi:hypothetical protein
MVGMTACVYTTGSAPWYTGMAYHIFQTCSNSAKGKTNNLLIVRFQVLKVVVTS